MTDRHPRVDAYFARAGRFREIEARLREILLTHGLGEDLKWGKPCYAFEGKNIILINAFKHYCAVLFFKGALLADDAGLLVAAGEHSHSARQLRFTDVGEVEAQEVALNAFILQAIAIEQAGLKVDAGEKKRIAMPDELRVAFEADPAFEAAFSALTPGRQRAYLIHFTAPKQSATKTTRIGKCRADILAGKGFNER